MNSTFLPAIARLLLAVLVAVSIYCAGAVVYEGLRVMRAPYFFDADSKESPQFIAAIRVLEGKPIFPDYAEEGVYNVYGFMHTIVYAVAMRVFGATVAVPKAVVVLASIWALLGIAVAAYQVTGRRVMSVIAVGCFAALNPLLPPAPFYSLRPEAICASLSIWGLCAGLAHFQGSPSKRRWAVMAMLLFTLAALSKQTFALLPVVYGLFLLWRVGLRRAVAVSMPAGLVALTTLIWFDVGDEHFVEAVLSMSDHDLAVSQSWMQDRFTPWVLSQIILLAIAFFLVMGGEVRRRAPLLPIILACAFIIGLVPFLKVGGAPSSYLYFEMVLSVLVVTGVAGLSTAPRPRAITTASVCAAMAVFFAMRIEPVMRHSQRVPYQLDVQSAYEFIRDNADKRIYFPSRNFVTYLAASEYDLEEFVLIDRSEAYMGGAPFPRDFTRKIDTGYFDYIIGPLNWGSPKLSDFLLTRYGEPETPPLSEWQVYVPLAPDDPRRRVSVVRRPAPLLENGSFERTHLGKSIHWFVPGGGLRENPEGVAMSQSGNRHVGLLSVDDHWNMLMQYLNLLPTDGGRTLVISSWVHSTDANAMRLSVAHDTGSERIELAYSQWPASIDAWGRTEVSTRLPDDVVSDQFVVRVSLRPELEGRYLIDDVEAGFEMLSPRSFMNRDKTGRPRGWGVGPLKS